MINSYRNNHTLDNGFTILEVLISMVIIALILTIVYSAFSAGSKVCSFGSKRAQIFHSSRLAMQDIIQSIENLEYGTNDYYELLGESRSSGGPGGKSVGDDELEFATSTSPSLIDERWHAGLARVKYIMNRDKRSGEAILEKWVSDIEDEDFKDAYVVELSHNIAGITFRYYDDTDFDDSWDSDIKERLPEFVEITFDVMDGDTIQPFRSGALIPNMRVSTKTVQKSKEAQPAAPQPGTITKPPATPTPTPTPTLSPRPSSK